MKQKKFLSGFAKPLIVVFLLVAFFTVYNAYLVDASLETIRVSLEQTAEAESPISAESIGLLLNSALVNELSKPNADLSTLNALDLVSSITGGARGLHQLKGSVAILKETLRERENQRFFLLRWIDWINQEFWKVAAFIKHSIVSLFAGDSLKLKPVVEYQLVREAKNLEKAQDFKQAKAAYEKFLSLNPNVAGTRLIEIRLASVETKLGEFKTARDRLKKVTQRSTDQTEVLVARNLERQIQKMEGLIVKKTELEKSIRTMTKVTDLQNAYFELGLLSNQLFDLKGAQEAFKKAVDIDPLSEVADKARFSLGFAYKMTNNIKESEKVFLDLSQKAVSNALQVASFLQLASVKKMTGDFAGAVQVLNEAAQKAGDTLAAVVAQFEAGNVYLFNLNDTEKADQAFREFQRLTTARGAGAKTITIGDSFSLPMREYAFFLFEKGRLKEAREVFETILKTDENDAWSHSGLGTILELQGKRDEGYQNLKEGYGKQPDYYTASALAYIEERRGNLAEAVSLNKTAIKLNPNYLYPYYNLGHILITENKFEEAVKVLSAGRDLSIKLDRKIPLLQNNLGYSFYNLKQYDKALAMFNEALVQNGKLVEVWYNRALLYEAMGNMEAYRGDLEQVLKLNPTYKDAKGRLEGKIAA